MLHDPFLFLNNLSPLCPRFIVALKVKNCCAYLFYVLAGCSVRGAFGM